MLLWIGDRERLRADAAARIVAGIASIDHQPGPRSQRIGVTARKRVGVARVRRASRATAQLRGLVIHGVALVAYRALAVWLEEVEVHRAGRAARGNGGAVIRDQRF